MKYLAILRLLLRHSDDLASIVALLPDARAVIAGPGWVADRLAPTKRIIDVAYPIADELEESLSHVSAMSLEAQNAEVQLLTARVQVNGIDPAALMQLVNLIMSLIEVIRAMRGGVSAIDVPVE